MDFSIYYLLQARERQLSPYNWGAHQRQLSPGDEVLVSLSSSGYKLLYKLQWNVVVIHQVMDVAYEVTLKEEGRNNVSTLISVKKRRQSQSVWKRWVISTLEVKLCACVTLNNKADGDVLRIGNLVQMFQDETGPKSSIHVNAFTPVKERRSDS